MQIFISPAKCICESLRAVTGCTDIIYHLRKHIGNVRCTISRFIHYICIRTDIIRRRVAHIGSGICRSIRIPLQAIHISTEDLIVSVHHI